MLNTIITSKTRLRLLIKFFINVANTGYLRGLAAEMEENTNAIRKELNNLTEAGFLQKEEIASKIIYKANTVHPLFHILQQMVRKHVGIDVIVERVFERLGAVSKIYLIGDYANGIDSGIIEVVVEGVNLNEAYLDNLERKVASELNKKIVIHTTFLFEGKGLLVFQK
ncbi:transcriptional regulator [Polaribacter gangjinensis]|uniref:Transcriptional regulator n=1 Tax=Polaribacter gangjinensis TaxID=574710 RepID=A0A2S7W844_9FLAO|nr:transcriptional regulator [Polaribacter gangjinensis]PQJ73787.1 transcriptional regulator [Polaribacter gangjinensis]